MVWFVVFDRRFQRGNPKGWKRVIPYSKTAAISVVPHDILTHWKQNKSPVGYAPLRGLTIRQLHTLAGLSYGRKVQLGQNRIGDIHAYKVVT